MVRREGHEAFRVLELQRLRVYQERLLNPRLDSFLSIRLVELNVVLCDAQRYSYVSEKVLFFLFRGALSRRLEHLAVLPLHDHDVLSHAVERAARDLGLAHV